MLSPTPLLPTWLQRADLSPCRRVTQRPPSLWGEKRAPQAASGLAGITHNFQYLAEFKQEAEFFLSCQQQPVFSLFIYIHVYIYICLRSLEEKGWGSTGLWGLAGPLLEPASLGRREPRVRVGLVVLCCQVLENIQLFILQLCKQRGRMALHVAGLPTDSEEKMTWPQADVAPLRLPLVCSCHLHCHPPVPPPPFLGSDPPHGGANACCPQAHSSQGTFCRCFLRDHIIDGASLPPSTVCCLSITRVASLQLLPWLPRRPSLVPQS